MKKYFDKMRLNFAQRPKMGIFQKSVINKFTQDKDLV